MNEDRGMECTRDEKKVGSESGGRRAREGEHVKKRRWWKRARADGEERASWIGDRRNDRKRNSRLVVWVGRRAVVSCTECVLLIFVRRVCTECAGEGD